MPITIKSDINVEEIMGVISDQFVQVLSSDEDFYKDYEILLTNEQQSPRKRDYKPNAIYIVVKFMTATINFGQIILPITINAVGEKNKINVAQRLLLEYAQTFNLTEPSFITSTDVVKQTYTSPSIMSNFNDITNGFVSLFYMSGTFLLSNNNNGIKSISVADSANMTGAINIDFISCSDSYDAQLDPKVFYNTKNFTKSVSKIASYTLNFTTYVFNNAFFEKINAIKFRDAIKASNGIQTIFYITLELKNGQKISAMPFVLAQASMQQNMGELAIMSITLVN